MTAKGAKAGTAKGAKRAPPPRTAHSKEIEVKGTPGRFHDPDQDI